MLPTKFECSILYFFQHVPLERLRTVIKKYADTLILNAKVFLKLNKTSPLSLSDHHRFCHTYTHENQQEAKSTQKYKQLHAFMVRRVSEELHGDEHHDSNSNENEDDHDRHQKQKIKISGVELLQLTDDEFITGWRQSLLLGVHAS